MSAARNGDELRVADGSYSPDVGRQQVPDDPFASFTLDGLNIRLRGSFAGFGEANPDAQTPDVHSSILSGAIGGDFNSLHVLTTTAVNPQQTLIEGFTLTLGQAFCYGEQCPAFTDRGGGILNHDGGSPRIERCLFIDNQAGEGAGIGNINDSHPVIARCRFENNHALGNAGGAIHNRFCTSGTTPIVNCEFYGNSAYNTAGAVAFQHAHGSVTNGIFVGNTCGHLFPDGSYQGGGGAVRVGPESTVTLSHCDFVANASFEPGGGVAVGHIHDLGEPPPILVIHNCVFWDNWRQTGAAERSQLALLGVFEAYLTVGSTNLQGGRSAVVQQGGRLSWENDILNVDPLFARRPSPLDNDFGDLRLSINSPCANQGNCLAVPADAADLDGDQNQSEQTPFDLDGLPRIIGRVDLGAYESPHVGCQGDADGSWIVDVDDLVIVITNWLNTNQPRADVGPSNPCGNGIVDIDDLVLVISHWGPCPTTLRH